MSLRRLFAVLALVLVLAPLAARAPLFDPDEGLHAAIAQEMVRTGDYVTPRFLGEPFLDKPILFFWAEALSLRVFGMNEAAVRLPPLFFGVLGMIGVALFGRAIFGEDTGLIAGMIYGTMLLPLGVGEVAVHDVAVVPFMCAAVWLLLDTRHWASVGAGIFLGLTILTKGLVGIAFAGIFVTCYAIARPSSIARLAIALVIAVVVAAAVAAPWYVAMEHAHPGYLHYYFVERHLQGYLTSTQRHAGRPWWYYLPIVVGGALPWTAYLASAARKAREDQMRLVVWGWFVLGLVFLSIGESKLVTYVLPLFPALALLIGDAIVSGRTAGRRFAYVVYFASLAIVPLVGLLLLKTKFGEMRPAYWLIVGSIGGAVFGLAVVQRRMVDPASRDGFPGLVRLWVMAFFAMMVVAPRAAAWMTARDLAGTFNRRGAVPSRVLVVDERIGSVIFYLSPALRAQLRSDQIIQVSLVEAVQHIRTESLDAVVAVRNNQLQRFVRLFSASPVAEDHAGTITTFRVDRLRASLEGR
jgi:4-amino-4-deoxy-L-arabinose transferase-like glycosyltransferase